MLQYSDTGVKIKSKSSYKFFTLKDNSVDVFVFQLQHQELFQMYLTTTKLKLKLTLLIKVTLWMPKSSSTILETKLLYQLMAKTHLVIGANTFIAMGLMKYSKLQMDKVRFKMSNSTFKGISFAIFILDGQVLKEI